MTMMMKLMIVMMKMRRRTVSNVHFEGKDRVRFSLILVPTKRAKMQRTAASSDEDDDDEEEDDEDDD